MEKKTYISIASVIISILLLIYAIDMCYTLDYFYDFTGKSLGEKGNLWFRNDIQFLLAKKNKIHDTIWMSSLYLHIIGSLAAILIGPFQFISYFRAKFKKLHQFLGKIYIGSILFLGFPTGLYMAVYANGGIWASLGFTLLSFLWLGTTYFAYKKIKKWEIEAHQNWMIRSYAITFAAVMLRIWTPLLSWDLGVNHNLTIALTAWLSWIPNLLVAELLIFMRKKYAN
jgi:uncharacterized membrane protein